MYIRREASDKGLTARITFCEEETDVELCQAFVTVETRNNYIFEQFHNLSRPIIYFSSFFTPVEHRNKGYGRKMLKYIKEYYKGCIVFLHVAGFGELSDEQLVEFYKSEGFKEYNSDYPHNPLLAIVL
jgi:GNAT superfamily N-acetyltransferase